MKTIRSVQRALLILEVLRKHRKPLRLNELSKATELSNATLLRLLITMEDEGFIVINKEDNTYFLGHVFLDYSNVVIDNYDIKSVARPIMERINSFTEETVNLYIISGFARICIDQIVSNKQVKSFSRIGDAKSLHSGAAGKILLAYSDEKYLNKFFENCKLKSYTENTIIEKSSLIKQLEEIRNKGYAISYGERERGIISIAIPLYDFSRNVVAAISMSGPDYRVKDKYNEFVDFMCGEIQYK